MDDREYSLIEHLAELRTRMLRATMGVTVVAIGAFVVSEDLLRLLREPMERVLHEVYGPNAHFVTTSAAEYIFCQLKAAMVAGVFLASPWILYQAWLFIAPGLYDHERRYVTAFVWAGSVCFVGGAVFAYLVVFPPMFEFFIKSQPPDVQMLPSLSDHFSFTMKMLLAFGVVFETPVVIFILSLAGIVNPNTLANWKVRRYVVVVAFVVGAILTPSPDILSQFLLAGPLLVLWELGVLVSRVVVGRAGRPLSRKERAEKEAAAASDKADTPGA